MAAKRRRRGRRKNRGFASWSLGKKLGVILGGTALAVLATGLVIVASKMSKIETTKLDTDKLNISEEVEHETGYTNVALFGLDSRAGDLGKGNRSDTIMIASLNNETKEVKLVSVYRDTLLELDDGSYDKANAAYSYGGPEGAISLINKNLDMNIEKYVAVNFNALVDVIDALGGLELELTDDEVVHMNNYCVETSEVTGADYTRIDPEVGGTYLLNGVQAVSYSRIRYTEGGDFQRASRQRLVLSKIAEKAQTMSLSTINKIIDTVFPQVSTNFTLTEMISYAKDLTKYKMGESIGFPSKNTTDTLNKVGSVVIPDTLSSNVLEVHQFLFGNDGYTVSGTVQGIESGIQTRAADRANGSSDWNPEDEEDENYAPQDDDSYSNNSYNNNNSNNNNNSYNNNNNSNNNDNNNGGGNGDGTGGTGDGGTDGGGNEPAPEEPADGGTGDGSSSEGGTSTE